MKPVWLPAAEAKCSAARCAKKERCARYLVDYTKGRPLADFSLTAMYIPMLPCVAFLDAAKHRTGPPSTQRPYKPMEML